MIYFKCKITFIVSVSYTVFRNEKIIILNIYFNLTYLINIYLHLMEGKPSFQLFINYTQETFLLNVYCELIFVTYSYKFQSYLLNKPLILFLILYIS